MIEEQTEIGEIISVSGSIITVQLLDTVKSNMLVINGIVYKIGQIGSFLKVPLGYTNLYGIVTQVGASAIPESFNIDKNNFIKLANQQFLNIVLIGEQTGRKFERGISQYPTIGDKVCLVTIHDLK